MTQHRDLGSNFYMSLPNAFPCRLSSGNSSPCCPPFVKAWGEWLRMKILCFGCLRRVVLPPGGPISPLMIETQCLSPLDASYRGGLSQRWYSVLGSPVWVLVSIPIRRNLLQLRYLSVTSTRHLWEWKQPLL